MTKLRAPLSFDGALARIAGQLPGSWAQMAEISARSVSTVRNWGDPDTPESIPVHCAVQLDIAYQQAGGAGAPLLDTYSLLLEVAQQEAFICQAEIASRAKSAAKESGEATEAQIACILPGAAPQSFLTAIKETEEAIAAHTNTLALLKKGAGLNGAERASPREGDNS